MIKNLSVIALLFATVSLYSQGLTDTTLSVSMITINLGGQMPGEDLAERYGFSGSAGASFWHKTSSNWLMGAEFNYIFSENVKDKDHILSNISTSEGAIIDGNGQFAEVYYHQRGFYTGIVGGRLFPVIGPNKNSGLFFMAGAGILQHKTRIENPENKAPQISYDYALGYDRLTRGFAVSQFAGYLHLGSNRLSSFYAGVELVQAWTRAQREHDFSLMKKDTRERFDTLYSIRIGWVIPIYGRTVSEYYYH